MMPTFNVWQDAQTALAAENDAARRWRDAARGHRPRFEQPPRTGRRLVVLLVAVLAILAIGATIALRPSTQTPASDGTTPADALPWRLVEAPSGAFRVELPAKPTARTAASPAGAGQELAAAIPGVAVIVAFYATPLVANDPTAAASALINQRADLLDGYPETVRAVKSRAGEAFEAVVVAGVPTAIVRVIVDGPTLYVIEVHGDTNSARTQQIYDRVVLSFTPTNTR
jgi:hypothetical protein